MKNIRQLFRDKEYLLNEPKVEKLIEYCEEMQDEIVEYKFEKTNNKELAMLDMIKEVVKGCEAVQKEQYEHERFGYDPPDYENTIKNLKSYIVRRCHDLKIYL